ncbi:MAG: HAD-IA family hydrolase [Bacteroidota bacterium]
MSKPQIDTIIFDLGGVLIDWNPRYIYRKMFEDEEKMEWFLKNVTLYEWNIQQDAGRPIAEAEAELIAQWPEWEEYIRAYYGKFPEALGGAIHETVEILESLKKGGQYRLLALTNWSSETFPVALERFEFLQWFEGIVVSGTEKVKKPDTRIYQILLDRYQVDPTRAIFTDDNLANAAAAQGLGIHAIHFQSPMQFREALADLLA